MSSGESQLLDRYEKELSSGQVLALLPVSRLYLEKSEISCPGGITFFQQGVVDLAALNCKSNTRISNSLSESISAVTGVTIDTLSKHTLVALPSQILWSDFLRLSHKQHLEFIEKLSYQVDRVCFDYVIYKLCDFYPVDSLPGRIGSLDTHPIFAAALIYNPESKASHIISGSVFSHAVMKGIGLMLEEVDSTLFPKDGEVGRVAKHALTLYRSILDSSSHTSRFVQAMSLLEFLAFPDEYRPFKEVKKIVASYAAKSEYEYKHILDRFLELTGKKDQVSNKYLGYRTRIVHLGERIEEIVPNETDRKALFKEISGYIKAMLNHMIDHSDMAFQEYTDMRKKLARFSS